jgi:hypothetical protein
MLAVLPPCLLGRVRNIDATLTGKNRRANGDVIAMQNRLRRRPDADESV